MKTNAYVLNRGKTIGVKMTSEQYALLVAYHEKMPDLELERRAIKHIKNDTGKRIPAEEVIGHPVGEVIDHDDGWE